MSYFMDRRAYADTFDPTVGDRVGLADTELLIKIGSVGCASRYYMNSDRAFLDA